MPRNVRSTAPAVGEDVTDKAGWMYADLFLALMVIFLATISFVPEFRQAPTTTGKDGIAVSSSTMNQGVALKYSGFDPEKLKKDIARYKKEHNLSSNTAITYVQIIGGYQPPKEALNAGTMTAVNFGLQMKNALPDLFSSATFAIETSPNLASNTVSLRITFA